VARLIYSVIASLDGYIADENGDFDWAAPDEHLLVVPIVIGGGNKALPDGVRMKLELIDERRFRSGVVHLGYRTTA
jgi:dihydrofolate reductase